MAFLDLDLLALSPCDRAAVLTLHCPSREEQVFLGPARGKQGASLTAPLEEELNFDDWDFVIDLDSGDWNFGIDWMESLALGKDVASVISPSSCPA